MILLFKRCIAKTTKNEAKTTKTLGRPCFKTYWAPTYDYWGFDFIFAVKEHLPMHVTDNMEDIPISKLFSSPHSFIVGFWGH